MSEENTFSGFMPMISQINISQEVPMIASDGNLMNAHSVTITTKDGHTYVFSMENQQLMKLFFLIMKVVN
jgi:hypothetical protein